MDKSMIKGVVVGSIAMTAMTAIGFTGIEAMKRPAYAEVLAVKEATEIIKTPREECRDINVQKRAPTSDNNRIAGTVIGALAGGLIGSSIGRGAGNTVATVAGAAAGGYAGNTIQKSMQDRDTVASVERRCKTVMEETVKKIGFDVSYRLGEENGTIRMSHDPGPRIPVKDGKLVLDEPKKT